MSNELNKAALSFISFDVLELSFSNHAFRSSKDIFKELKISVVSEVLYNKEDNSKFQIFLNILIAFQEHNLINSKVCGSFKFDQAITPELKLGIINTNAPAIVYPYLRSFISNITSQFGSSFNTIRLPLMTFTGKPAEV